MRDGQAGECRHPSPRVTRTVHASPPPTCHQAMGTVAHNQGDRIDTILYLLVYPQATPPPLSSLGSRRPHLATACLMWGNRLPYMAIGAARQDAHDRPDRVPAAARRPQRDGRRDVLFRLRHRGRAHPIESVARPRPRPVHGAQEVHVCAQEVLERRVGADHAAAGARTAGGPRRRAGRVAGAAAPAPSHGRATRLQHR